MLVEGPLLRRPALVLSCPTGLLALLEVGQLLPVIAPDHDAEVAEREAKFSVRDHHLLMTDAHEKRDHVMFDIASRSELEQELFVTYESRRYRKTPVLPI